MSATGPGKPYRKIPEGSTGETMADEDGRVDTAIGTGTATGVGRGGIACVVVLVMGAVLNVGVGTGISLGGLENMRAVSDAPAAAEVAAITARVNLDMWRDKATLNRIEGRATE